MESKNISLHPKTSKETDRIMRALEDLHEYFEIMHSEQVEAEREDMRKDVRKKPEAFFQKTRD